MEPSIDFSQWGMTLSHKDDFKIIYNQGNTDSKYIFYSLYPGIEMILTLLEEKHYWSKKRYAIPNYFQIAYSHYGIYKIEVKKEKFSHCCPDDLYITYNMKESFGSENVTSQYKGFNLLIFSDKIPDEVKEMMKDHFDIDLNLIEEKLKRIKVYCILRTDKELKHICEEIYNLLCSGNRGAIRLKILELLNYISSIDFSFEDKYQVFSKECIEKTKSVRDYMIENLSRKTTIDYICKRFDITPTLFKRCFKELFQYPPHEYLNRIRMARAAELLVATNMNILEVSVEIGYSSSSNFSRAFRDIYNISPLQYRKDQIKLQAKI